MDRFFDDFDVAVQNLQKKEAAVEDPDSEVETLDSTLEKLWKINQELQHRAKEFLDYLHERLDKNLVDQTECQVKICGSKQKPQRRPLHTYSVSYFRNSKGFHPPLNEEAVMMRAQRFHKNPSVTAFRQWSTNEQSRFLKLVEANGRAVLEKPLKWRIAHLAEKREKNLLEPSAEEAMKKEICDLRRKISAFRKKTFEHLLENENIEFDWLAIATSMLRSGFDRDETACERMWKNFLHPNINRNVFTPEEDDVITELASKGKRNWTEIAASLNTNRTAFQCFQQYQRKLNKNLRKTFWTEEEDEKLIKAVESCRVQDMIPWKNVQLQMKGWSMAQLQNRWDRNLKPQNREGKWTPEEDAVLLLAVPCVGRVWMQICTLLHGRTSYFCRERYTNTLDPALRTGRWTWEEDKRLLGLLASCGEKWGTISRFFKGRTDNMINQRCTVLKRCKPRLYERVLASKSKNVLSILPKKQFARSNICNDVNDRRKKIREAAFKAALNAIQQYHGSSFDASACSTFNQLAKTFDCSEMILWKIAKILVSDFPTVTMKRPVSHYSYKRQMKVEAKDTDDGDEDGEWHSDTDRDEDEEMGDGIQEDCNEVIIKEEETMTQEEIHKLNVEFNDFILPAAVIGSKYVTVTRMVKKKRTQFEYSAMLRCFLDCFRCKDKKSKTQDPEEETENSDEELIYRRVDYGKIVPQVIGMFVIGMLSKDFPPVFPPNRATLDAYNMLLVIHDTTLKSKLEQVTEDQNAMLATLVNETDLQEIKSSGGCAICKMCNKKDGMDESGSSSTSILCPKCKDKDRMDNLVASLFHRFAAAFIFPAIMSRCRPSEHQLRQFVLNNPGHICHRLNKQFITRGVKRVYCSDSASVSEDVDDDSKDEDYVGH